MPQVINTNVASLNTQRHLNSSQSSQMTSLERLSSGLRINSAKDDAAGLAISERMSSQVRGLSTATRNANDGISLAQTAEGALGEIGNNLQRIRELAVQSRNATNSATDRAALNTEVQALKNEIDRIADTTSFNGVKLLDGNFTNQDFQVGANVGDTITVASLADANTNALGTSTAVEVTNTLTGNAAFDGTTNSVTINSVNLGAIANGGSAAGQATNMVAAINAVSDQTGVYALSDGADLTIASNSTVTVAFAGTAAAANTGLTSGANNTASQSGFENLDISTTAGADVAINQMDSALTAVNTARAELGAIQSRFDSVIANNQTTSENLSAARSRILDTDFAAETAALSRSQVLQQAGTAMLGQANQLPQNVLGLLR